MTGATSLANLVWNATTELTCTNSTFSNSKGWGIVLESSADFFDFVALENGNSFSGNTSGDVNIKIN